MLNKSLNSIEVILKTVERCNINCTYCYFFNGIDQSYLKHPPYISATTILQVAKFLRQAAEEYGLQRIHIDLHGGEPLMQKPTDFDHMCETFYRTISPVTDLFISVQTNGMLINETWLQLFEKYAINVGVSLDGPQHYNDVYRLDKKGKSTYQKTINGINLLKEHAAKEKISQPGVLCVINPEYCAKTIYHHFVHELGIRSLDFLLPDITHDGLTSMPNFEPEAYGKFLCTIFDEWAKDDDPQIKIRILRSTLSLFLGGKSELFQHGTDDSNDYIAFTISSNGAIAPDDTMRSSNPAYMETGHTVFNSTLTNFLNHPTLQLFDDSFKTLPDHCHGCQWQKVCGGGSLINRYSQDKLFNSPSVMCSGLKIFYQRIYDYIVEQGAVEHMIQFAA